ncbi:MAG TPA: ubiquinol-cytochrome c reductase iron-sulfur subunit [Thermoanaerobaculia bacterium]|jgi:Rieske Fe-S protein
MLDRRRILNWFLGTSVGALTASAAYPVARFVSPPEVPESTANEVDAGPVNDPELLEKGFKIVRFGQEPVIVLAVAEGEYRAFAATCTHLDCIVEYRQAQQVIWCNCHDGVYDLHGRNVAGPPPRPLQPYQVHVVARGSQPASLVISKA